MPDAGHIDRHVLEVLGTDQKVPHLAHRAPYSLNQTVPYRKPTVVSLKLMVQQESNRST
jgi:hypothetical protein